MATGTQHEQIAELRRRMDQLTGRLGQRATTREPERPAPTPLPTVVREGVPAVPHSATRTTPQRPGRRLAGLPGLSALPRLLTGAVHRVDHPALSLALAAGASADGGWLGIVGMPELGYAAAAETGIALERTIVVPDPGVHWMSVLAELAELTDVIVVDPPAAPSAGQAEKLRARFRLHETAVLSHGEWPRYEVGYHLVGSQWFGAGLGEGYLQRRRAEVDVVSGPGWPPQRFSAWLPGHDQRIEATEIIAEHGDGVTGNAGNPVRLRIAG